MKVSRDDRDLRERFQDLRAEVRDSAKPPAFHAMWERARREAMDTSAREVLRRPHRAAYRRAPWMRGAVFAAVAAAITGVLLFSWKDAADLEFERLVAAYTTDAATGAWRSPTRRFLEVPGMELLHSVPAVGRATSGGWGRRTERHAPARERYP